MKITENLYINVEDDGTGTVVGYWQSNEKKKHPDFYENFTKAQLEKLFEYLKENI